MPHEKEFSFCRANNDFAMATRVNSEAQKVFQTAHTAIELASEIAARYRLASIDSLLASCRNTAAQDHLSIAILGRFKAGKSK